MEGLIRTCVVCESSDIGAAVVLTEGAPPAQLCETHLASAPMLRFTATLSALREAGPPKTWDQAIEALPAGALTALAQGALSGSLRYRAT